MPHNSRKPGGLWPANITGDREDRRAVGPSAGGGENRTPEAGGPAGAVGVAERAGRGAPGGALLLAAARQIEPGWPVLEAPDPASVYPVAPGHRPRLASALEIRALAH